jgi:hypothetical protein
LGTASIKGLRLRSSYSAIRLTEDHIYLTKGSPPKIKGFLLHFFDSFGLK